MQRILPLVIVFYTLASIYNQSLPWAMSALEEGGKVGLRAKSALDTFFPWTRSALKQKYKVGPGTRLALGASSALGQVRPWGKFSPRENFFSEIV